jgi:hypothetical protein
MATNNEQQAKTCTGDCMQCNPAQRVYCSAQMSIIALQRIDALTAEVKALREELKDKSVFNPMQSEKKEETDAQ